MKTMKEKNQRFQLITDLLRSKVIGSQVQLLQLLREQDCDITQATLSRDLRHLKVLKTTLPDGNYKYVLPVHGKPLHTDTNSLKATDMRGIVSVDFSGNLAVIKTRPGFAGAIAWDIDKAAASEVIGTLAGDDTLLVIPREGISRHDILAMLKEIFGARRVLSAR